MYALKNSAGQWMTRAGGWTGFASLAWTFNDFGMAQEFASYYPGVRVACWQ